MGAKVRILGINNYFSSKELHGGEHAGKDQDALKHTNSIYRIHDFQQSRSGDNIMNKIHWNIVTTTYHCTGGN